LEDLRRVEAPDGRFWCVQHRPSVLASVVEAFTEALPCERYRWRVTGLTRGRSAAVHVARALRAGKDPTPENATLISHTVDSRILPPTGNVNLV
jgi:hypothetical protein